MTTYSPWATCSTGFYPFGAAALLPLTQFKSCTKQKTGYIAVGQLIQSKSASSGLESAFSPGAFYQTSSLWGHYPAPKGNANYSLLLAVEENDWTKIMITSKKWASVVTICHFSTILNLTVFTFLLAISKRLKLQKPDCAHLVDFSS